VFTITAEAFFVVSVKTALSSNKAGFAAADTIMSLSLRASSSGTWSN
jgi:hypothetical protein